MDPSEDDAVAMERMFTSVTSSRGGGLGEPLRSTASRKGGAGRRTVRKLQVAHVMARTVTAVLYVDAVAPDPHSERTGCVWWWSGGHMNVHDVRANNTTAKGLPLEKVKTKSVVKALALDRTRRWVWAGHDNGCAACADFCPTLARSAPSTPRRPSDRVRCSLCSDAMWRQ